MRYRPTRHPTDYPTRVRSDLRTAEARIINVSSSGCRLSGITGLHKGQLLTLQIMCSTVTGTVSWISETRVGISFTVPLNTRQIEVARYVKGSSHGTYRTTVGFSELT
jgi:hypothetical protein